MIYDSTFRRKGFMYEYVTKKEYRPVREELEKIIKRTQIYMREKFDTTFQFQLIGSGGRHLITRVINGNGGYDFDYNLIVPIYTAYLREPSVLLLINDKKRVRNSR